MFGRDAQNSPPQRQVHLLLIMPVTEQSPARRVLQSMPGAVSALIGDERPQQHSATTSYPLSYSRTLVRHTCKSLVAEVECHASLSCNLCHRFCLHCRGCLKAARRPDATPAQRERKHTDVKGADMYPNAAAVMYVPGKVVIFGSQCAKSKAQYR